MIDLHTHTTASDGNLTFEELVIEAKKVGLKALAITDHDNIKSAEKIKFDENIELIPGAELSIFDSTLKYMDIHMIALFIDTKSTKLNNKLKELEKERFDQKNETIKKLNELGYEITLKDVLAQTTNVIGRPHIAKALLKKYPNNFRSINEIFTKLLSKDGPAYIDREIDFGFEEAIDLVKSCGGLSFVAHPHIYKYEQKKLLVDFKKLGGSGVEVYYDYKTNRPEWKLTENNSLIEKYHTLAKSIGLLESGGSDFHGALKNQKFGSFVVPYSVLVNLKK